MFEEIKFKKYPKMLSAIDIGRPILNTPGYTTTWLFHAWHKISIAFNYNNYLTFLFHQTTKETVRQHQLKVVFLFLLKIPWILVHVKFMKVSLSYTLLALTCPFVFPWRSLTLINLYNLLLSALSSAVADNLMGEKSRS